MSGQDQWLREEWSGPLERVHWERIEAAWRDRVYAGELYRAVCAYQDEGCLMLATHHQMDPDVRAAMECRLLETLTAQVWLAHGMRS